MIQTTCIFFPGKQTILKLAFFYPLHGMLWISGKKKTKKKPTLFSVLEATDFLFSVRFQKKEVKPLAEAFLGFLAKMGIYTDLLIV